MSQVEQPGGGGSGCGRILVGCAAALGIGVLLTIGGCVGFYFWMGAEGPVSDHPQILRGEESAFGTLYLTEDNPALLELCTSVIESTQQLQGSQMPWMGMFQPDPETQSRQQLEELLPLRVEIALYDGENPASLDVVAGAEISRGYRWYRLMYEVAAWGVTRGASDSGTVVKAPAGESEMLVVSGTDVQPSAIAFVGNRILWGRPPSRVARLVEQSGEGQAMAPDHHLGSLLADAGGAEQPVWGFAEGQALEAVAGGLRSTGEESLLVLAALVEHSTQVAAGFELVAANEARIGLAGLTAGPEGTPGEAAPAPLVGSVKFRHGSGLHMSLDCDEPLPGRWRCEGRITGFQTALTDFFNRIQQDIETGRNAP